ncbi:DapH/DapD/GlmU-related protein [Castellaniella sp.]|uniref:DapH/DapD/GlmU-related protein n=1 Tax=Castellaniella sp. TaxID=1955812 RepID=UPI002AFF247D|nr:DapH/DapD/GlmU-related protein [Castellaniella sp.]
MRLSSIVPDALCIRDFEFSRLGYVDSLSAGLLVYADKLKYVLIAVENPNIAALITTPSLAEVAAKIPGLLVAENPRDMFYAIHQKFINAGNYRLPFDPGVGENCRIHSTAVISPGCRIGDNVSIAEHVVITDGVEIGSNVQIGPGVKLGVDGILYSRLSNRIVPINHAGYVRIGDHVTMMANSVAVRSIHDTDFTEIGDGSLIGLGAIIGHEAKVGMGVVISNQCVVARRSVIGNNSFLGTHVVVKENIRIGSNANLMAGSVVIDHVSDGEAVSGNFAVNHKIHMLGFLRNLRKIKNNNQNY